MNAVGSNRAQLPERPDRPHLTPNGLFMLAAIMGFPIVAAFAAIAAPKLALLQHRAMPVLAANHLVTLGWGTMMAIGSLHQMLPAAVGARRGVGTLVAAQFVLYLSGVVLMAIGFWTRALFLLITGGSAIFLSISITLGAAVAVFRQRTRWEVPLGYVATALACLGGVVGWGLALALNWRFLFWRALLGPMGLTVHLSLGLVGWFGLLIAGISYYLLSRFTPLKSLSGTRPKAVFLCLAVGLGLVMVGAFLSPLGVRAGLLLMAVAGLLYTADVLRFLRAWRDARDITRSHWQAMVGETALLSLGLAAQALDLLPGDERRWAVAGVSLFLLGWVTLAITGQAYKVTPFLMWYYRYSLGMGPLEVPRLGTPYRPPLSLPSFVLVAGGGLLISLGVLLGSPVVSLAGGIAFFVGALLFSYLLGYSWLPKLF